MLRWLLLLGAAFGAYIVAQNVGVNPHYTRLDGYEQTARKRRRDLPPPSEDPRPRVAPRFPSRSA